VAAGDAVLLLALGSEGAATAYFPDELKGEPASGHVSSSEKNRDFTFRSVVSKFPVARIRISYANPDKAARFAELRVNGRIATRIAFPGTGSDTATGALSIETVLDTNGAKNVLTFSSINEMGPAIQSVTLP
jgi:hypothetical protein